MSAVPIYIHAPISPAKAGDTVTKPDPQQSSSIPTVSTNNGLISHADASKQGPSAPLTSSVPGTTFSHTAQQSTSTVATKHGTLRPRVTVIPSTSQPPSSPKPAPKAPGGERADPQLQRYVQDPYASEMTPEQRFINENAERTSSDPPPQLPYTTNGTSPVTGKEEGLLVTASKYLKDGSEKAIAIEEMVWKKINGGSES